MGAKTAITEEQYLRTSFPDLDREFVQGEVIERSLPDYPHARTQALLGAFFAPLREQSKVFPAISVRLRMGSGVVRIPDVCVFHPEQPTERFPSHPPLVATEVLSRDDRMGEVRDKLEEYRQFGVQHVWLVDPYSRRTYSCEEGFQEVDSLKIPELGLELKPSDIFE